MKKIASIIMTLVTALLVTMPAFAAETGTITINNSIKGKSYSIYRIFDVESYNAAANAYSYKMNEQWGNWSKSQTKYVTIDEEGYVHWKEGADAAAFAKEAITYAKANKLQPIETKSAEGNTLTFSNLKLGYYLVDSSTGVLCSLDTTNPKVEMKEKNAEPTVKKEVEEDSTGQYGETNDADIDQTVNFRTTITVQAGGENYALHDKMSAGLTFDRITSVKVDGKDVASGEYSVKTTNTDGCTFEIHFANNYIEKMQPGKQIEVEYSAHLNGNAIIAGEGNPNETWLTYGDNNSTTHDYTRTFAWSMDVFKFTENNGNKTALSGAKFVLSKTSDGKTPISFKKVGNTEEYLVDAKGTVTEIVTNHTGGFVMKGLDEGIYYLVETKAPDGYHKLAKPVTITIESEEVGEENDKMRTSMLYVEDKDGEQVEVSSVEIKNITVSEIPQTGDIGTAGFYILGGLIAVSAATILVIRKRIYGEK